MVTPGLAAKDGELASLHAALPGLTGRSLQELAQMACLRRVRQASGHLVCERAHLGVCVPGVRGEP